MKIDGIKFDRLFLESGLDLRLSPLVTVKHPKISDILMNQQNSEDVYWRYVSMVLCDPYQNMVLLHDEFDIDYEDVDSFDVFCLRWDMLDKQYRSEKEKYDAAGYHPLYEVARALCFFLGEHAFALRQIGDERKLVDPDVDGYEIGRSAFNTMTAFIQLINGLSHAGRINPADKNAKAVLIAQMRDEIKREQRKRKRGWLDDSKTDTIGNMVATVVHGGNGGVSPFNFMNAAIYQIVSAYKLTYKKFHADHLLGGLYAGTVKSESINNTSMDWAV